jgi:cytidylate kinase
MRAGQNETAGQKPVITISATYGTGAAIIGERVAQALGVRFLPHVFTSEQMEEDQRRREASDAFARFREQQTRGDNPIDDIMLDRTLTELESHTRFEVSDEEVLELVGTGGVVVGRAAPHILRDVPGVLHVLLDGPRQARIAQGAEYEKVDLPTATRRQQAHDASRKRIAESYYGADPTNLRYYNLVLDTTALGFDDCVELILGALQARRKRAGLQP